MADALHTPGNAKLARLTDFLIEETLLSSDAETLASADPAEIAKVRDEIATALAKDKVAAMRGEQA